MLVRGTAQALHQQSDHLVKRQAAVHGHGVVRILVNTSGQGPGPPGLGNGPHHGNHGVVGLGEIKWSSTMQEMVETNHLEPALVHHVECV